MLVFRLERTSSVAPYAQLVQQVREALRVGWISPGDRLPSIRDVVRSCGVNANTVLKAYRELELLGVVESRQGLGAFIKEGLVVTDPKVMGRFQAGLWRWARQARQAGLDDEDIRALLGTALSDRRVQDVG